ncbi:MAG: hypothetical protein V4677_03100 [Bacteroidota bacterium]
METTKPKEMFHEDIKAAELAAKNVQSPIMYNYHDQLARIAGMYTVFFNNMAKAFPQPFNLTRNGGIQDFNQSAQLSNKVNSDPSDLSKVYKETIDSHLEASKNLFKTAIDTNIKMMAGAHTHFNSAINQTQTFWNEVLKASNKPLTEEDAYANEAGSNDGTTKAPDSLNQVKDQKNK